MENGGIDAARVAVQSQQQQHLGLLFSIFVQSGIPSDLLQTAALFLLYGLYWPAGNGWQSRHCIVSQLWLESVLLREHSLFLVISTFLFILDFSLFLYITSGHMYGRW